MTLHAKSACDVYLSFRDGGEWNSDDLERMNFIKINGEVEDSDGDKYIIHHKHFVGDEKVILPKTSSQYYAYVTIFVK